MADANSTLLFISMGIDIQDIQYHLAAYAQKNNLSPNLDGHADLELYDRRTVLIEHIQTFHRLQAIYMPNLRAVLTPRECQQMDSKEYWRAETAVLFLPSEITTQEQRERVCIEGLGDIEIDLRVAELRGALRNLHCLTTQYILLQRQRHGKGQQMMLKIGRNLDNARHCQQEAEIALMHLQGFSASLGLMATVLLEFRCLCAARLE
ncbi:hypothetical protein B0H19DRAFT_1255512 [Mycena capillaripes]|nr:hypothetical protein B0H19DRAFT_1255512 [Mycena capillaripes]